MSTNKSAYNRLHPLPYSIQGQGDSEEFGSPTLTLPDVCSLHNHLGSHRPSRDNTCCVVPSHPAATRLLSSLTLGARVEANIYFRLHSKPRLYGGETKWKHPALNGDGQTHCFSSTGQKLLNVYKKKIGERFFSPLSPMPPLTFQAGPFFFWTQTALPVPPSPPPGSWTVLGKLQKPRDQPQLSRSLPSKAVSLRNLHTDLASACFKAEGSLLLF